MGKLFAITMGIMLTSTLAAQSITYNFKPPQNNFYIKWIDSEGDTCFHGYISGGLWGGDPYRGEYFYTNSGAAFVLRRGGTWNTDYSYSSTDAKHWVEDHLVEPEILCLFYTEFWRSYNAAAGGKLRAESYHKGRERFLGVNCDMYVDNLGRKYWVDPSNGCTLKMAGENGTIVYELTEYNLNFLRWPDGLPPG